MTFDEFKAWYDGFTDGKHRLGRQELQKVTQKLKEVKDQNVYNVVSNTVTMELLNEKVANIKPHLATGKSK